MIRWIFAAILFVWLCALIRRGWRAAGATVDERWANRSPYFNRNDP